jgi:hypothetical protein
MKSTETGAAVVIMYSTARQHSFTRVHVALKDGAHRVHASLWQVTTGACGPAYCCPCPARHAGAMDEGPASAAECKMAAPLPRGVPRNPALLPRHTRCCGRACPSLGEGAQEQTLKPQPLARQRSQQPLQAPHRPQARSPRPARRHRAGSPGHLRRTARGAERQVGQTDRGPCCRSIPQQRKRTHRMETQPGHPKGRPESGRPLAGRPPPPSRHA